MDGRIEKVLRGAGNDVYSVWKSVGSEVPHVDLLLVVSYVLAV